MFSVTRHPLPILFALFALLATSVSTRAQSVTGSITGTVTDVSGAVVPGAAITLIQDKTAEARTLSSDNDGRFTFAALQPGGYSIRVERQGFQTLEQKGIILSANETLAVGDLKLQPGQVSETVSITSEGTIVERESSDLTARLTADQISLISTKGRDITSLLRLIPGTSNDDDIEAVGEGFGTNLPNISGQRGRSTVSTIDGLNASEPSGNNKLSMTINQDAVAEVKVLRNNYAAEYGNNGGALINLVSKGGGKDYRGTAYYFLRNEALNASPFFNNKAGLKRPLYRHNIWGFNVGGPAPIPRFGEGGDTLLRDKVFFFFSYEKPHQITPQDPRFVTVPTALERAGDFSQSINSTNAKVFIKDPLRTGNCNATDQTACFRDPSRATASNPQGLNIIPLSRFNRSGQALVNYFPLPNTINGRTATGGAYNYVAQSPVDVPKRSMVIRFDVKSSEKDSFYWKGQLWTSDNLGTGTSGWPSGDASRWGIQSHYLYKDNGLSLNWVHIFSASMVNEATLGLRHDSEGFIPGDGEIERLTKSSLNYTAPQLFPENNTLDLIPRVTNWSGVLGVAPAQINWLSRWGEVGNDYILPSFADNMSITRGDHSYKFGLYLEHVRNGEARGGDWSGSFNFSGTDSGFTASGLNTGYAYANALIGNFAQYNEQSGRRGANVDMLMVQWYGQDQWKINRRLTVNYGLRLGWNNNWLQRDLGYSNFDPTKFDPKNAQVLYRPFCVGGTPATAACANANRRAQNPVTGQLSTNTSLVGTFVPGVGNPLNGIVLPTDPDAQRGFMKAPGVHWEPRVGFAWDLFGRGKTVLRTMGGVYHTYRLGGGTTGGNLVNNTPFQSNLRIDFGSIDQIASLVGTALQRTTALKAVDPNFHPPTIYNYSLGIQQELGFKTVIEISYVGSQSRHLGEQRNINGVPDGAKFIDLHPANRNPFSAVTQDGPAQLGALADDFLRPFQGYQDIQLISYTGNSNYNGLQVQVNRRYTRGLQFGVAYTWSKTLETVTKDGPADDGDASFGRPYRAFNYGPADFDQTHIFTVNYIWDVPKLSTHLRNNGLIKTVFDGWQISGTTSYATGKPKAFGSGTGLNWTYAGTTSATNITDFTGGEINARPVLICDPNRNPGTFAPDGTPYVIDTSCFAKPGTIGSIGNLQRNLVRLPSIFNSDIAFFKNFRLGENRAIQLRWETYNVFNRANFTDINGAMTFDAAGNQTSNTFGTPRAARSPRVMQASLRFNF
ncbi:MAG TPA: carboxypeptidase regulatory-like domain-containing protein [Pyrinomonadaceae bacterium]|nr:carboxypeptidase regulatory-like domain-containing protein [Pyrinomonadaceae bacterium]